jgi:hypothetical protein
MEEVGLTKQDVGAMWDSAVWPWYEVVHEVWSTFVGAGCFFLRGLEGGVTRGEVITMVV